MLYRGQGKDPAKDETLHRRDDAAVPTDPSFSPPFSKTCLGQVEGRGGSGTDPSEKPNRATRLLHVARLSAATELKYIYYIYSPRLFTRQFHAGG